MCNFMSAIYTRTGEFYCNPEKTDSHEELIKLHSLKEGLNADNFVRVEFNPPSDFTKIADTNEWTFVLDERITPGWWEERKEDCLNQLHAKAKSLIVSTEIAEIRDRFVIIVEGAKIGSCVECVIRMSGGTLNRMSGGTLNEMYGGTINRMSGGTLNRMYGGTLNEMYGGTLNWMYGGTINRMSGGTLNEMYGGTLNWMSGGTLNEMSGGTLNWMSGGTLNEMSGGTLNWMYGGTINRMSGGTLNEMYGGTLNELTLVATVQVYRGPLPTPKDNAVVIDRRAGVVKVLTAAMAKKPRAKKVHA